MRTHANARTLVHTQACTYTRTHTHARPPARAQVYPIGISLADAAIVGVTLRVARGLGLGFAGGLIPGA